MWLLAKLLLLLHISKISAGGGSCTTPEGKQGSCVFIDYCPSVIKSLSHSNLTRVSVEGWICNSTLDYVCCTEPRNGTSYGTELSDRRYCGYQQFDNYYGLTRNDTSIDEFPWLAAILGIPFSTEKEIIVCHGSLINNRYVLTAAQCFRGPNAPRFNITKVLLGEYQRNTNEDCVELPEFQTTFCIQAEQYQIEEKVIHPFFHKPHYLADIALIRLDREVTYTDYIRPICLPIQGTVFAKPGEVLYTTGWGHTMVDGENAVVKKKILTMLIPFEQCYKLYRGLVVPEISYLCSMDFANNTSYSCDGDAGAPVMFQHRNQWHIEGIVSRGAYCSNYQPGVQTRVASHLEWIKQNIKP